MELGLKKDFDLAAGSWDALWKGELKRPVLLAIVPKSGVEAVARPLWGAAFSEKYEDVADKALRWAETHDFLGDSVPFFTPSLIIDLIPALLGAEIVSVEESWGTDTHAVPFIEDLSSTEIRFDKNSIWWGRWVRLCECIREKCSGKLVLGSAVPGYNNLDTLAALRGADRLMFDFYDNPEGVHFAMKQIMKAYNEIVAEHCRLFETEFKNYGCVTHHGFYSKGTIAIPQCDFGFNIGKEHFDEFGLPYLREEFDVLDSAAYHLDGPGNIAHIESIAGIEKIGVVQWVAGSGNENKDWQWLFEKINDLNKGLWLSASTPDEALELWKKYNNSGRMVLNVAAESQDDMGKYIKVFEDYEQSQEN